MNFAYLSLGSNVQKEHNLPACVHLLANHGRLLAVSSVYETAPVGNPGDPPFFNAALLLETPLAAADLKEDVLRTTEQRLGRRRSGDPNAPRPIDVDISLFNRDVLQVGRRHIPDPEILLYPHVVVPLAEIAPDYRHPETGETLAAIARRVLEDSDQSLVCRPDILLLPPAGEGAR
jgi:2-amino-4-hydroxy-6-hydroxymethyldihydropteridine diphosphokinase